MAAETIVATRAASTYPVSSHGLGGNLKVAYGTYTIAANVEAGDIFEMCKVPAGATVIGGYLQAADLDTNASETIDIDIGWKATDDEITDTDGFGNLGVLTGDASVHLPVAGIYVPFAGVLQSAGPKTFTAEATIQLYCNAAAATGGTGVVTVVVFYVLD